MQVDGKNIENISSGYVGIKMDNIVRENDHVYKKVEIKK
jgi:putative protease